MKRGVSLIAVLMFMLAATTASVVLFRMLSSENFSSGARLKASEAYQASESGIDAVRSWLSNRGTETGDLVTQYMKQQELPRKSIKINLGDTTFKAFVIGVDASGGNNKPVRVKILVEGKGRDGSKVTQTAILKVSGLYKVPTSLDYTFNNIEEKDEEETGGGGSTNSVSEGCVAKPNPVPPNCAEDPKPGQAKIDGYCETPDFWGNMESVGFIDSWKMIITQTMTDCNAGGQALNSITIGKNQPGYMILDGNFYVNNGLDINGDLYVNGEFRMCAKPPSDIIKGNLYVKNFYPRVTSGTLYINGSAYLDGLVQPNVPALKACGGSQSDFGCIGYLGGIVDIKGNTTIMGPYNVYPTMDYLNFKMEGNLVMGNNSYINLGTSNESKSVFEVTKSASVRKLSNAAPSSSFAKTSVLWPKFNGSLCLGTSTATSDGTDGGYNVYKDVNGFYFKTKSAPSTGCNTNIDGADPMDGTKTEKNLKQELSQAPKDNCLATKTCSCNAPPVAFDTDKKIYPTVTTTSSKWAHRSNQRGSCNASLFSEWTTLLTELNNCWTAAKAGKELYLDQNQKEWLVIYMTNNRFNPANGNLGDGKYIIIFDLDKKSENEFLYLPPTGKNAQVMLYFPRGFYGRIELSGNETNKIPQLSEYNYFIFSDGDIQEFNTTKERTLHGNVLMNDCKTMNVKGYSHNPYFYSQGNEAFVKELMGSGILSSTPVCEGKLGQQSTPPITVTYNMECSMSQTMGTAGKPINKPTVTCRGSNGTVKPNCGFTWVGAPTDWDCPAAGEYTVKVKGNGKSDGGDCKNAQEVQCGKLVVEEISSSSFASSSSKSQVRSSASNNNLGDSNIMQDEDWNPWIPVSTRLAVKIVSKEISKEKVPEAEQFKNLEKSVLVMPRVVHVDPGITISDVRKYYSYMPLNGAIKADTTQSNPQCKYCEKNAESWKCKNSEETSDIAQGLYLCEFPTNTQPYHSPFYLVVGTPEGTESESALENKAVCKLNKRYTHGENVVPRVSCLGKNAPTPSNVVYVATYGPPLTIDERGNHYYPGPAESDNAVISVSGKCGEEEFDEACYYDGSGGREYTISVMKPSCRIDPGPHYSECPQSDPYSCSGTSCCKSKPELQAPTHDCKTAFNDTDTSTRYPQFNYSAENDGDITGNRDNIGWNKNPPQTHNFNTIGLKRVARMFEISCGGHWLRYGTINGKEGINCGEFDIIKQGTTLNPPNLPACQANVRCSTNNYCSTNTSVPPPVVECNMGGSPSSPSFRYTESGGDTSKLSTGIPKWNSGENHTISSTRKVFLLSVNCGGTTYLCGTGSNTMKGLPCGMVEISSSCTDVTASCTFENGQKTLTVTQGQNIRPPTITCSVGTKRDVQFSSSKLPKDNVTGGSATDWLNDAHYGVDALGDYRISASVICGEREVNTECGTITVNRPTCVSPSGDYVINTATVPPPTYSCGAASASNPKFNYTGASNGAISSNLPTSWNNTPSGNHSFTGVVNDRHVYMYQVNCDGHTLNLGSSTGKDGVHCSGSFNIVSSGSSGGSTAPSSSSSSGRYITCEFAKSSYTVDEGVGAPTITCRPDGNLIRSNANFTITSGISPYYAGNWRYDGSTTSYGSTGTSTVKVSGVLCGSQNTPDASCGTLTITAAGSTPPSSASTPSSNSSGGGSGGTINLATVNQEPFGPGTFTLNGGKNTCMIQCSTSAACSISGAINATPTSNGSIQVTVSGSSVTITGSVKFNQCW